MLIYISLTLTLSLTWSHFIPSSSYHLGIFLPFSLCFPSCLASSLVNLSPATPTLPLPLASALCTPSLLFVYFPPSAPPPPTPLSQPPLFAFALIFHSCCSKTSRHALLKPVVFSLFFFFLPPSYSPLSSPQSRPTHPSCSDLPPPPPLVLSIEAEQAKGGGGGVGQTSGELPLQRQRLRQRGTLFTSADTHSDTKTPGSGFCASSHSLSPRLAAGLHRRQLNPILNLFFVFLLLFPLFCSMPHPGLIRIAGMFL